MPRTQEAERAAPRTDQVGTLATLTTAGLLATVGAVLVLVLGDDVSPWWWTAVGLALLLGVVALVATVGAVLRRGEATEEGEQPTGCDAGEPATTKCPLLQPPGDVPLDQLPVTIAAIDETVAVLVRRVGEAVSRRLEATPAASTEGTTAATRGGGSTRAESEPAQKNETT